jgi:hypothetical protein
VMTLEKTLSYILLAGVAVAVQIGVMVYGWGLSPKSLWWIIGIGMFGLASLRVISDKIGVK